MKPQIWLFCRCAAVYILYQSYIQFFYSSLCTEMFWRAEPRQGCAASIIDTGMTSTNTATTDECNTVPVVNSHRKLAY
jgi:hypothetical protein